MSTERWADGLRSGPNVRPDTLRGWLRTTLQQEGKPIATVICPRCHVEIGWVLDTDQGELLVLITPPLPPPRPNPTTTDGSSIGDGRFSTSLGDATLLGVVDDPTGPTLHARLVDEGRYVVFGPGEHRWIETSDGVGWLHAASNEVPFSSVETRSGPQRITRPRQPDVSMAGWRWINPAEDVESRGPLGDDDRCSVVCNRRSTRHLATVTGAEVRGAIGRYRSTGRARDNNVVATIADAAPPT